MALRLIALSLALVSTSAVADCIDRAAARFALNPDLLRAIAEVESNNRVDAIGPMLRGGDRALGKMQVNSVHLQELKVHGVTREDLMTECGSVFVGAWILARYVALVGPTWEAVGVYNTGPASKNYAARERYITKVKRRLQRIQQGRSRTISSSPKLAATMATWGTP